VKRWSPALLVFGAALGLPIATITSAGAAATCFGKAPTVLGTEGADRLVGTARADVISGLGGRDRIVGRGGNDRICGDAQRDRLRGGPGGDRLRGGEGSDDLWGARGEDVLVAGSGALHSLYPGAGDDLVFGARNVFDKVDYSHAPRAVSIDLGAGTARGYGSDTLRHIDDARGSRFDDTIRGNRVWNFLFGGRGDDTISARGNAGGIIRPDFLVGGPGNDSMRGGDGFDVVDYSGSNKAVAVDLRAGRATGQGVDALESIEGADATRVADILTGNGARNVFQGRAGNDRISGGGGADIVAHFSAPRGVTVDLGAGSSKGWGSDSLESIERIYGSHKGDVLRGDGAANVLRGLSGRDVLAGRRGDDALHGGPGRDTVNGGKGSGDVCAGEDEIECERNAPARTLDMAWWTARARAPAGAGTR
jgi:Ca2+-binding RTX toxin-like protein